MSEQVAAPELSIVVSTIGRPDAMARLLDSLVSQTAVDKFELIVVDQSDDQESARVVNAASLPFRAVTTTSGRGACRGRNVGTALAQGQILAFPDDNCLYTPDAVTEVVDLMSSTPRVGILSGLLVTAEGSPSMLRWPNVRTAITRSNVQRTAIEATMFIRRDVFASVGGFDESIGVGSAGPYQAGEATDLILRALSTDTEAVFDPRVRIIHEDSRQAIEQNYSGKMRGYGRGIGRVYRINHLPAYEVAYYASRKVAAAVVRTFRGRRDLSHADLAWAAGLVSGYLKSGNSHRETRTPAELEYRGP